MTFEEFFIKKKIDLVALQAAAPALFAEFKAHYQQMGEKSFDHTKKYWFNKLRLLYHLKPEVKAEKIIIENRLAEQTIVDALTEPVPQASAGFKPRFKPGMAKRKEETSDQKYPEPKNSATATPEVNDAAGQKEQSPQFQQEKEAMQDMADHTPRTTDEAEAKVAEADKVQQAGYKPRFNMKTVKKPESEASTPEDDSLADAQTPLPTTQNAGTHKPGFKPRFNMKMVAKPSEDTGEDQPEPNEKEKEAVTDEATDAKELDVPNAERGTATEDNAPDTTPPAENIAPKMGFKPRFNAKNIKPKPPEE